jgi:tetratricopeptide (TPR) repeat protein/polyferredoxin
MSRWRAASLLAVYVLMGLHIAHWKLYGRTLAPVEPSEMFDTLHLGIITVGFLFMVGAVLATAIAGRFFCGWGCHILALQDLCAWLLRKLKIPTRPIRSRTLLWVPPLAALYLFVWPQVERLLAGESLPTLRVVTDPDGWTSFTTTDLLRSFPGLGMTLFTFAVCGFVLVYFLGSRSFCRYACPYGAVFAAAEQLSPLRIVAGPGDCSGCGLCIATCKSNVRVIEEVRQFAAVVDVNCMKDLDCVSVCPTGALRYGTTRPPLFRWRWWQSRPVKPYDFSFGEDLFMAGVFVATLPIFRGLYDSIAFLLALALSALLAYFAAVALRLLRRTDVSVGSLALKNAGSLTVCGRAFACAFLLLGLFVVHSGFIRYHMVMGERAMDRSGVGRELDQANAELDHGLKESRQATNNANVSNALQHFEAASRWGLFAPRGLRQRLATLYLLSGTPSAARDQLHLLLASDAEDRASRVLLAEAWLADGRTELARQQLELVLSVPDAVARPAATRQLSAAAHSRLGDIHVRKGEPAEALESFSTAVQLDSGNVKALLGQGAMLAATENLPAAAASFEALLQLHPNSAVAHNNLAAVLVRLDRNTEALEHYERARELDPANSLAHCNVGTLLAKTGRLDEAERAFAEALHLDPNSTEAQAGLAFVKRRRNELSHGVQ